MTNPDFILNLSPHLFWDVDRIGMDPFKSKRFIVQRVMDYGLMSDWKLIYSFYGLDEIAQTALTIRELDPKSAAFIALLSQIPIEKFLCYNTVSSRPPHWNF